MFDIGFLELFVIGIIALIVLGPERLPKAARTVGLWVGKAKQGFNSIKTEIDRELKVQELQQQIEEQKSKLEEQVQLGSLKESMSEAQSTIGNLAQELKKPLQENTTASDKDKNQDSKLEVND